MSDYITRVTVFHEVEESGNYKVSAVSFSDMHGSPLPYEILVSLESLNPKRVIAFAKRGQLAIWTNIEIDHKSIMSNLSSAGLVKSHHDGPTSAIMFGSAFLTSSAAREDFQRQNRNRINTAWDNGGYKNWQRVGRIMDTIADLPAGSKMGAWIGLYTERCLGWEGIYNEVSRFSKLEGFHIADALNVWWKRIIENAFDGWENEQKVLAALEARAENMEDAVKFVKPSAYQDRNEGVDFIAVDVKSGIVRFGIQVKVGHYVRAKTPRIMEAKKKDALKYARFSKNNNGAPVWIAAIDEVLADSTSWKLRKPEGV